MKHYIKVIGLIILAFTLNITSANAHDHSGKVLKTPPISVQLWSVREDIKKDFKGTLAKLAAMGFQGVEFAGQYGPYENDAAGLKNHLDALGLKASGAHVSGKILFSKDLDKTLDFLKELDVKLVILPGDGRSSKPAGIDALSKDLTKLSAKLQAKGLTLGYHNHAKEFNDYQNSTFWDYIAQNTPPEMALQLDAGWANYAGKDAIAYVKRYANRTLASHIKIRTQGNTGVNTIIGQSDYNWAELVKTMMLHGGTQWLVIEQEELPKGYDFLTAVAASKKGLEKAISHIH